MPPRPAVFVDRDGVLNALVPDPESGLPESPLHVDDVQLLDGVAVPLLALRKAGYLLVLATNQPAAAKGTADLATIYAVNDAVLQALAAEGVHFDDVELCPHHPDGTVPELTLSCDCRKPEPGMLLAAARVLDIDLAASWMIGDSDADIGAGRNAGCRTILVEYSDSAHRRGVAKPDARARNLSEATAIVLGT